MYFGANNALSQNIINSSAGIPLYFTKPIAANGIEDRIQIKDHAAVGIKGERMKYIPTEMSKAKAEKIHCLSESPKKILSL